MSDISYVYGNTYDETIIYEEDGTVFIQDQTIVVSSDTAGPPGPTAIHVGPTPPTNTSLIWIDTSGI